MPSSTAKYRDNLPQLSGGIFLTDGGIETTLIFVDGFELPEFAAFVLLKQDKGVEALRKYYQTYADIARSQKVGFILEAPTWRASSDWGTKIGYSADDLLEANQKAISLLDNIRQEYETDSTPIVISGLIGPRGDGYTAENMMSADEAQKYHAVQIETFSKTSADMVASLTMTYAEEAIGIVRAAMACQMPVVISFTVETDGRLPSGQALKDAIEQVDTATKSGPVYYMLNCAHPSHFEKILEPNQPWAQRIQGLRANASKMSHAELDEAETLDDGNPQELGNDYAALKASKLKKLNVVGGCCGTDSRHVECICKAMMSEEN